MLYKHKVFSRVCVQQHLDLSYTVTLRKQYQEGQMQLRLFYIYYLKREKHSLCL